MFNWFKRKAPDPIPTTPPPSSAAGGEQAPAARNLAERLSRSAAALGGSLRALLGGGTRVDDALLDEIEATLIAADVGVKLAGRLVAELREGNRRGAYPDRAALFTALRQAMYQILLPCELSLFIPPDSSPFVVLMVGVNGAGKTTTIGKMAQRYQRRGYKVMLAAGDTFRAAAVEQLQVWGERNQIPVIAQGSGADSASVIFDALQAAKARGIDLLIADTAGRLHTQNNLMAELAKVKRVLKKLDPTAPHETLLVIDGSQGQNALLQARQFHQEVGLDGVVITKLDGTAKGGIVFAVADELKLPLRLIGVGEGIEDLREFRASEFLDALLPESLPTDPPA